MRDLINLKIDYAFKLIFGKKGNEPILITFLNAVLRLPQEQRITGVTLLNPELNKEYQDDKKSVLDIRAETNNGTQVNIEIQMSNRYDMEKRSLFYWAEMYARQMQEGMSYKQLAKTITINILGFDYLDQSKTYHSVFRLYEEEEKFQLTDALEMHFVELPKFTDRWRRREVSPWEDVLVRWLLLLEGSEDEEIFNVLEEIAVQDPILNKAIEEWEKSSDDPRVREEYYDRRKAVLDELAAVKEAELRVKEAELRLREALQQGKAEGKAEIAKNLLDMGFEISKIVQATGLSEQEVRSLQAQK